MYFNKVVSSYTIPIYSFFKNNLGFGSYFFLFLLKRMELNQSIVHNKSFNFFAFKQYKKVSINVFLSTTFFTGGSFNLLNIFEVLRFYLTNSYKGKCHMLGKPANGQRT